MAKLPRLLRDYCRKLDITPSELIHEVYPPEWEQVQENFLGVEKYNNVTEEIWKHVATGRFFRFVTHGLPYGITDYGMAPEDPDEIEEVFPVEVTATKYLTTQELKGRKKAEKTAEDRS